MLSSVYLFFSFSGSEIMFILFVALILFGGDKFPEIARGLGRGIREFKDMSDGVKREIHSQINSYEANPNRDNEVANTTVTPTVEPPQHPVSEVQEIHQTPIVTPPIETPPAAGTQTIAEIPKKPDLSQPPNTISHQSY